MNAEDRLLMSMFGSDGNTQAHSFISDQVSRPNAKPDTLKYGIRRYQGARIFIPPKEEDRVIMFADKSGVYVHSDGLCTPMGDDISEEINQWVEEPTH